MDNTVEVQVQELGKVMITNRGEYISSKSYEILDIVSYNGSSFMSKIDDNTSVPAEEISPDELLINENWQLVAKKGDTYKVTEEDLQAIAKQITDNAKSAFNQNVETKTKEFNTNATNKLNDYDTNAKSITETFDANAKKKLDEYNANDTKKLKAYNDNADSKLGAYNTNDTNKLKAYNTNADSKIEEYNTNANSKIAEYDEHSEELRNMAISTDNKVERLKNEVLDTGTESDTFIHIEDSCMAKLKELEIEGVCEQETTSGKNLFDENNATHNLIIESGSITTNNSWSMSDYIEVSGNTDYVVKHNDTTSTSQSFILAEYDVDKKIIKRNVQGVRNSNIPYTITTTDTTKYLIFNYNNTYNNTMLQLEKGSTPTDYEPYTGCQPSPSPDFPKEIKTITDSLKIISCGKNLVGRMVLGELNTKTGIFEKSSTIICNEHYIPYDSLNRYYIKVDNASGTANIRWYNQKFEYIGYGTTQSSGLINKYVYTDLTLSIPSDTTPKYFKIRRADVTLLNSTWCVSTDPNYFGEYVESLITANLPEGEFIGYVNSSNRDILRFKYNEEDRLYHQILNKFIKKVIIYGTKGSISMPASNRFNIDNALDDYLKTSSSYGTYAFCTNYIVVPQAGSNSDFDNFAINYDYALDFGGGTANNIRIKNIKFSNVEDFKNDLKLHPIILYYILKPESRYELDIGTAKMPLSYKEITNIFTNSDLLPKITAEYYRTFETSVQNLQINDRTLKQEITDLNVSLADVIKRLEALEIANATTVEESEVSNDLQN
mgnify:CR=1 FL=1